MAKMSAFGTLLKRSGTTIAQVQNLTGPSLSVDTIDVTSHDSASAAREFIAGLLDGGTVEAELLFDPDNATHVSLRTDLQARVPVTYTLNFPDPTPMVVTLSLIITGLTYHAPHDGALTASLTAKVTGLPTWA